MGMLKQVEIFTDGSCSGNPGPGGCSAVLKYQGQTKGIGQGFRWTTSNRMKLMAVIFGLETLQQRCSVSIYSDSEYVVNPFQKKSLEGWKARWWLSSSQTKVANEDLWRRVIALVSEHKVEMYWHKKDLEHPESSLCYELARNAAYSNSLLVDENYERLKPLPAKLIRSELPSIEHDYYRQCMCTGFTSLNRTELCP
jgi:ribonuclease HI